MYPIDQEEEELLVNPEDAAALPDEVLSDEADGVVPPEEDLEAQARAEEEKEQLDEEAKKCLKEMIEDFERIEQPVREKMVRYWKKLELFWKGIQNIYWDYAARDYRKLGESEPNEELDYYYQDKIVNICRAHGESVISALSQDIPAVIFPPDDADNPTDVQTSKGYTKASELLGKCNDAEYLLMYGIYILWNQGVIGAYNYNLADFDFGSIEKPNYVDEEVEVKDFACPNCGNPLEGAIEETPTVCPTCEQEVMPFAIDSRTETRSYQDGIIEEPKKREKIEFYGPLSFRIPHYVTNPKHTPYVGLDTECHIDYARDLYQDLEITEESDIERYDRWARLSTDYQGELSHGLVTLRRYWLRSWTYNRFKKDRSEIYDYLRETYPDGVKVTLINDKVANCEPEKIDEHWTFTLSPLSSHIHAEPIGAALIPIQEMRNELIVLKLQTIEYGIPETFADPQVLDFDAYRKHENTPGQIYPAKSPVGQSLESGFTTLKTATFPKEAVEFQRELDSDGQFVSGAFPSIYGGSMPSASKTAAEYQMSRNQALQRLQTTWKIVSKFWALVMDKSVRSFISNMTEDERIVQRKSHSFINVYIRQNELTGKVGKAEPEIAQTFPMSWMQKRDLLMQLLQLGNEYIGEALFHPENTGLLSQYLGFRDFYIPGDDARTKQLIEIQKMLETEPIEMMPPGPMGPMGPEMGMEEEGMGMEGMQEELPPMEGPGAVGMPPQFGPSVEVDPDMDNHQVEYETIVSWMNSEIGMDAKETNPAGFMNVRMHGQQHLMFIQMALQAEQKEEKAKNSDQNKEKPKEKVEEMN
jgi:hypothetical protein